MGHRPAGVKPPAHLTPSPPVPRPALARAAPATESSGDDDPTRYGDWTRKGIAVDF